MYEKPRYQITLRKTTSLTLSLFLGAALVVGLMILSTILYGLAGDPERIKDLAFAVVLLALSIIFVLDRVLWQIRGIEMLIIDENIEVLKKGTIFNSRKVITFSEFESFDYGNDNKIPLMIRVYGIKGGKIIINYLGRSLRLGQDLSISQAKTIVEEVDHIMGRMPGNMG
jgi:hypothetical protein